MTEHFGVYGLVLVREHLLLVRKSRGPYEGLLDLPGGARDRCDSDFRDTLRREMAEETGLQLAGTSAWHSFEFRVTENSKGEPIEFRHAGVWTIAETSMPPAWSVASVISSADTRGALWISASEWKLRPDLSKLAQNVLAAASRVRLLPETVPPDVSKP